MKMFRITHFIVIVLLLVACESTAPVPNLVLEGGWVRAMPPGMYMTAAYGRITNHGTKTIEITSFGSDSFADVSLHLTTMKDGVSTMDRLPGLTQTAGTSSVLMPGGLHLMLMKPTREIRQGDSIGLSMMTASGEQYRFSLLVEAR